MSRQRPQARGGRPQASRSSSRRSVLATALNCTQVAVTLPHMNGDQGSVSTTATSPPTLSSPRTKTNTATTTASFT